QFFSVGRVFTRSPSLTLYEKSLGFLGSHWYWWYITRVIAVVQVYEFIIFFHKRKLHCAGRAVTLFGNNNLDNILLFRFFIIIIITIQETDNIGILLNTS